jgi:DNA-binding NarL/FixJ family response regulator
MNHLRVLLADDSRPVLDRVGALLASEFEIVGAVGDGDALLQAAHALHPDVCVIDISMPVMSGIEAAQRLRQSQPGLRIVMLTMHGDAPMVRTARNAGALGYVVKSRVLTDLALAIREAAAGRGFISPSIA